MDRKQTLTKAQQLLERGDTDGAIGLLRQYLQKYGNDIQANALIGIAYERIGALSLAEEHLAVSLAADDSQYDVAMQLIEVRMRQRKFEEALPVAERLYRFHPNDEVLRVRLESIRENVERPAVGWERDENKPTVDIEFTGD
jgi:tetratricopeptide (TPR) repeat protein